MVSVNTLCKSVLNVKNTVIENCNFYADEDGVKHIRIKARPNKCRPTEKERYAPPEKQSVRDQLRRLQAEGRQTKPKHRSHDRKR